MVESEGKPTAAAGAFAPLPAALLDSTGRLRPGKWRSAPPNNLDALNLYPQLGARGRRLTQLREKRWIWYGLQCQGQRRGAANGAALTPFFITCAAMRGLPGSAAWLTVVERQASGAAIKVVDREVTSPLPLGFSIAGGAPHAPSRVRWGGFSLSSRPDGHDREVVEVSCGTTRLSFAVRRPSAPAALYATWLGASDPRRGIFTRKETQLELLGGQLTLDGAIYDLRGEGARLCYDWSRGAPPRLTRWRWGIGGGTLRASDGRRERFGINLAQGNRSSASNENALWLGDRLIALGEAVISVGKGAEPWRFATGDGGVDLTATPFAERSADIDLLIAKSRYRQPFGSIAGRIEVAGVAYEVRDGVLFFEEHEVRW